MMDVAALQMLTTATGRGWDAEIGACGPQEKLRSFRSITPRLENEICKFLDV